MIAVPALYTELVKSSTGVLLQVVELHAPWSMELYRPSDDQQEPEWECKGCDVEGLGAESPSWPCRTVTLIARGLLRGGTSDRALGSIWADHEDYREEWKP